MSSHPGSSNSGSSASKTPKSKDDPKNGSGNGPGNGSGNSPGNGSGSSPQPQERDRAHFKAGVAALKRDEIDEAIAQLRRVSQGKYHERAQRALVVAYDKLGDLDKALALCYPLVSSPTAEIQTWAKKSLNKLKQRAKQHEAEKAEAPTVVSDVVSDVPLVQGDVPPTVPTTAPAPAPAPTASSLAKRNPRWRPLGAAPTHWWSWLLLALLGLLPLRYLSEATFWPLWIADYATWIAVALGVITYGLVALNRRRIERNVAPLNLRAEEWLTVFLLVWWVPFSLDWLRQTLNRSLLVRIPWWHPQLPDWSPLEQPLQIAAFLLFLALPWAMRLLLRSHGPIQVLSTADLKTYSPDAVALMRRFFRTERRLDPAPVLVIENDSPIIFSAAHVTRDARIFVSRGLLERLESEAIAALFAAELAQLNNRANLALPWLVGLLQLPYGLYRGLAAVGNFCGRKLERKLDAGFTLLARLGLALGGVLAAIAYGLFKLWRWPLLWLSRSRTLHSDRATADFLGDSQVYARALQAYAQALTQASQDQGQTDPLVESLELLLPLGLPEALTLNLATRAVPAAERLSWDCLSPYRRWLNLNNAHPLVGDRLARLNRYGQRSQVTPVLSLPQPETGSLNLLRAILGNRTSQARRQALRDCFALWKPLLVQGAPFYGVVVGLLVGLLIWMVGATASLLGAWPLDWILGDRHLLWGSMPLGVGLGLILRTNSFFPQKSLREKSVAEAAATLLSDAQRLPLAAEPVQFTGTLVGRPNVSNWLGQDLLLQTDEGPLRLHWCSPLGPAGNLWPKFLRPSFLLGREVVVSGWLRRGATLWLDVEQLQTTSGGRSSQRGHPMWAAVMAAIAVLWGSLILLRMA